MATAKKHFQPAFSESLPTYVRATISVPTRVSTPATRKPRLIGLRALVSPCLARTKKMPTIEATTPIARAASGNTTPERRVHADRVERRDAEDDRGDERDLVALEQVGRHAGAVADVVADVVGDRGRVARVVLGDARLDLADEVGADVGGLGEDAAADAQEQGQQRAAEPESDQDRRRRVLGEHDDHGRAEQAEADGEHPGDAAGAEGDRERVGHASRFGRRPRCGRCRGWPASSRCSPVKPDARQPIRKATVRAAPDAPNDIATDPSGRVISVEVKNTTAATGIRIRPIVRNCRFR